MRRFLVALLANLIVFGLAFVVVLVVGEVLVRRIAPATPRTYAPSTTRGWKPLPHLDITWRVPAYEGGEPGPVRIRTNARGFRMAREVGPKPKGVFRIALLGDSFTFGASVHAEHLYANVLERALRGRTAEPVEVVNLGVPGYGVHQEHVTLIEQGFQVDPDLVLVALYLGNDLQETLGLHRRVFDPKTGGTREAPDHRIVDGRMVPAPRAQAGEAPQRGGGLKGWLRAHLRLYAVLSDRVKENPALRARLERFGLVKPDIPRALPPDARTAHLWNMGTVSLLRESPPALEEAWAKLLAHLDAMAALCRAREIPMAVIVIPYRTQAVPANRRTELTLLDLSARDLDLERPGRTVRDWGAKRGVPVIDLLPVFRDAPDPGSLYFSIDTHWNDKGHEAAGHALADLLVARRLVPGAPR